MFCFRVHYKMLSYTTADVFFCIVIKDLTPNCLFFCFKNTYFAIKKIPNYFFPPEKLYTFIYCDEDHYKPRCQFIQALFFKFVKTSKIKIKVRPHADLFE